MGNVKEQQGMTPVNDFIYIYACVFFFCQYVSVYTYIKVLVEGRKGHQLFLELGVSGGCKLLYMSSEK